MQTRLPIFASSLKAPIYVLSNIAGVLINDVVIPQLPLVDINQYIEHGDIYGGMIPKVLDAKMLLKMAVLKLSLHQETSQISLKLFIIMILLGQQSLIHNYEIKA